MYSKSPGWTVTCQKVPVFANVEANSGVVLSRRANAVGVAFVCKDGSLNVRLDSAPLSGQTINIRDFSTRDRRSNSEEGASTQVATAPTQVDPGGTSWEDLLKHAFWG